MCKIFEVLCEHYTELALLSVAVFVLGFLQYKDGAGNCKKGYLVEQSRFQFLVMVQVNMR